MKPRKLSDDADGESSVMKTCCCCMDVRLGTIVLGFCHLVSECVFGFLSLSLPMLLFVMKVRLCCLFKH